MFRNVTTFAVLLPILTPIAIAQTNKTSVSPASTATTGLAYFEKVHNRSFDDFLKSIRPYRLAPELKTRVIGMLRKEDIVIASPKAQAKLDALAPILKYHDRSSVIDLKVMRLNQAVVMFLAGAAVLISERALGMLTAEELQAVVAHELGHEYFWNEYEQARLNKQYEKMQEIELRCDGMAVITMNRLGLDPSHLITAITKLTKSHKGKLINPDSYVSLDERIRFIQAMMGIVRPISCHCAH